MFGKIFGFLLIAFKGQNAISSSKVESWTDQEMEESLKTKEENDNEEVHS